MINTRAPDGANKLQKGGGSESKPWGNPTISPSTRAGFLEYNEVKMFLLFCFKCTVYNMYNVINEKYKLIYKNN